MLSHPATHVEDELYRENILDHAQHPHNFGPLPEASLTGKSLNPSCGDRFVLHLLLTKGVVEDARFEGSGCAISTASMSMTTDEMKGKTLAQLQAFDRALIHGLLGVTISAGRDKCASVSLRTLEEALTHQHAS